MIDIDSKFYLTDEQISSFRYKGFIKLRKVLSKEVISYFKPEFSNIVYEHRKKMLPMAERDTYQQAFIQAENLWKRNNVAKTFVFGKRLARMASELLGTNGIRLYHDQALYKEKGGGFTPWHADQYYWPMSTEKCCTVWIPLQDTNLEMGPIAFAEGSHKFKKRRNLKISDESEERIKKSFMEENFPYIEEPFNIGDISFHYGWTFHRAEKNHTNQNREVMTIIYMDMDMRLKGPENENQALDRKRWCPGIEIGQIINSYQNPILYQSIKF